MNKLVNLKLKRLCAVFGSARIGQDDEHSVAAFEIAEALSAKGVHIITGGGPGIMLAGNRGARSGVNGQSIGFRINLPFENEEAHKEWHDVTKDFDHFHFRQTSIIKNASSFIAFKGGCGTIFEVFNVMTLMQVGHLPRVPIQLFGADMWKPVEKHLRQLAKNKLISREDLKLINVTDSKEEVVNNILEIYGVPR